jgi:hypothetical protein
MKVRWAQETLDAPEIPATSDPRSQGPGPGRSGGGPRVRGRLGAGGWGRSGFRKGSALASSPKTRTRVLRPGLDAAPGAGPLYLRT